MNWVDLENLVSQQRTVVHMKMSHFSTSIIIGLSCVDWVELACEFSLSTKYSGGHKKCLLLGHII